MPSKAPKYDLISDFTSDSTSITTNPHWAICVVRLGLPLSYSRKDSKSVTNDISQGAKLRGPNLIIASDCTSMVITGSKGSHIKALQAELKQTEHNYLVEILPGDWVLAWIVNDEASLIDLTDRIRKGDKTNPCNQYKDGFKFLGRVDSIRKHMSLDRQSGRKTTRLTLSACGFKELDTSFFYDSHLAEQDINNLGTWLCKLGLDVQALFSLDMKDGQKNNGRKIIEALLDLIVGKGIKGAKKDTINPNQDKPLQAATGGAVGEASFAYLVPRIVGALLGKDEPSKDGGIISYADILDTITGIQKYSAATDTPYDWEQPTNAALAFLPDIAVGRDANRMFTGIDLLGTFIPNMPEFTNKPLWSMFQQFLNGTINEIYTCMRANRQGLVMPTMVVRQIPFTTEAFVQVADKTGVPGPPIETTAFLSVPRWVLHPTMAWDVDIGRSDGTRFNFIHVYGQDANLNSQCTFTEQLVNNPPIRDDLDIQRSGLRSYMTTVACSTQDTVGTTPATWIALVADRLVGSQYTLNGTVQSIGIVAPICEGDNLEWDNVVYHIESISHHCSITPDGTRSFSTLLTLTNGMRSDGVSDTTGSFPIYPGLLPTDNIAYDPSINVDDRFDRADADIREGVLGDLADPDKPPDSSKPMDATPTKVV